MSHNVDTMAFVGRVPWWGIGKDLRPGDTVADKYERMASREGGALGVYLGEAGTAVTGEEMLKAAGLDWEVRLQPVTTMVGGTLKAIADQFAVVRDGENPTALGVVGKKYHVVQNADLFGVPDLLVSEGHVSYETAGSLKGGQLVWSLARMGEYSIERRDGRQDRTERFLLWTGSHDGSASVIGGFTDVRVVCNNTLDAAMGTDGKRLKNRVSIRHTRSAQDRLDVAHRTFMDLAAEGERFQATLQQLANEQLSMAGMGEFANAWLNEVSGELDKDQENYEKRAARREKYVHELQSLFVDGQGNTGEDRYDAYNAVTQWLDHRREQFRTEAQKHKHMASTLAGDRFKRKGAALKLLGS